jgi:hypothetical protein
VGRNPRRRPDRRRRGCRRDHQVSPAPPGARQKWARCFTRSAGPFLLLVGRAQANMAALDPIADIGHRVSLPCMTPKEERLNRELRERLAARKRHFATSEHLREAFERSRDGIEAEVRRYYPEAEVLAWGPDAEARSGCWSAIVKVDTDEARRAISSNDVLMHRLRAAATAGGFPPEDVEIESVETVERQYQGNWLLRWKA